MAARRKIRARESQLAFEALSIEGSVLSPDWLARVAQLDAGAQSEADYHIPRGLNVRDEIGRYWRIAQQYWRDFNLGAGTAADPAWRARDFVLGMFREAFGFSSLVEVAPVDRGGRTYSIGYAALGGRVPVVIAPAGSGLDTAAPAFGEAGRRRSAFGVAQEFLNAADEALWGIATDGHTLRILRDNSSLTRPAWIEADLTRIFVEERYADFAALWLLVHESRFGRPDHPVTDCALETWRTAGREEGTRARAHLRLGVEQALLALGNGFLAHPDNQALRAALTSGELKNEAYFQQLLRLVYRLIFLLTVEERGVLHPADANEEVRALYTDGYSLRRLREQAVRRSAHDRFGDLWEGVKIIFRGAASGESRLGLPALAGIFAARHCPALDGARLENRHILAAMFRLSWLREDVGLSRVNWRDMGPEELGSVYEGLLELVPQITQNGRAFAFATGGETKGNARKLSGSYYTPDSLVQVLLDSALEPVVKDTVAAHSEDPVSALLKLSVVDPACGSGHFLLAAARRLAAHVARLRSSGTPSAAEYRHALREVVGRCIFGVDLNPMAVELCKVSLWMEAVEPGRPLSFLDSHIQHGNALLGTSPELMAKGIPDAAWEPIEGDDRRTASALKRRNKLPAQTAQIEWGAFVTSFTEKEVGEVSRGVEELEALDDAELGGLVSKEVYWEKLRESTAFRHQQLVADAWCAAFVWPKQPGALAEAAPTNELWRLLRDGQGTPPPLLLRTTGQLSSQYDFFHWHLAFPLVFYRGGFDAVLGNPPWERVKLQEQEFFASRSEQIAMAPNAAMRKKLIGDLPNHDPKLWAEWCAASRESEGQSQLVRNSGRYPLCGKGDVNTYALFAEHNRGALAPHGRAGFIVPTGVATDDTTKEYFQALVDRQELARFYSFENEEKVFPSVHNQFKFALLTIDRSGRSPEADLVFFARQVAALTDPNRHFSLARKDFAMVNPNTRTCPTFRARRDAELNLTLYRRAGVLWRDEATDGNPWGVHFLRMLDMTNDAELFHERTELEALGCALEGYSFVRQAVVYLPLFEAKMAHHFDHRFGTYEGATEAHHNKGFLPRLTDVAHASPSQFALPQYWVRRDHVLERLAERRRGEWSLGWRDVTNSVSERTVVASLIPLVGVGNNFPLLFVGESATLIAALYANLCSFALDYAARQKLGGAHLNFFLIKQLPVLPPTGYAVQAAWSLGVAMRDWLIPRVLELTYTAWDLETFAHDVGHDGPPFIWDSARRFFLRAELDAAFFHLYGISHDDAAYILDTFPIVRKNDEKAHGEYRTKRVILEIYDEMAEAARTGRPYQTRLDPPPADPTVAHRASTRPKATHS